MDARRAAGAMQAEAEESRQGALAMAQQLKRCVQDLAEAQKRIAAQDAVCFSFSSSSGARKYAVCRGVVGAVVSCGVWCSSGSRTKLQCAVEKW